MLESAIVGDRATPDRERAACSVATRPRPRLACTEEPAFACRVTARPFTVLANRRGGRGLGATARRSGKTGNRKYFWQQKTSMKTIIAYMVYHSLITVCMYNV